ncbi:MULTISPECIES: hypothetical protein [Clostridium]|uniref:hypothetical protein n=1 Tax=Clostridium TaxID=1485 RepID=UPI000C07EB60|nr:MULTISPECIES: hypothetical protein [Clostridium]MDU4728183.1 hypothetical protein [Clostridium sp.]
MIRIDELEKLKSNINEALLLSKKKQLIYDEIIGGDDEKLVYLDDISKVMENESYRALEKELYDFIFGLPKRELYNLHIAFSIGRLGVSKKNFNDEYLLQLESAKKLCEDKYYIEDKFVDIRYYYLEKYLNKGLNYIVGQK